SDVWSLGLTIIEISEARYPYDMSKCNSIFAQLEMLVHGPAPTLDGSRYSGDACDFVARCLQKDPDKRPNYTELLSHPWLVKHESCHVDLAAWARNAYEATDGHPPSQPRMD
ncbi:MAP kinase kinase Wis1, partial [Spiromyces aspiralis]